MINLSGLHLLEQVDSMTMLTPSRIRGAALPCLLIAFLTVSSDPACATTSDQLAFNAIFGEETVARNVERVRTLTDHLEPAERYEVLLSWVLPSETHASIRLNGRFLDRRRHAQDLYCPAVELVEAAVQRDAIAALRERVLALSGSANHDDQRAVNALLFLIDSKDPGGTGSIRSASRQLLNLMLEGSVERQSRLWPEILVCRLGLQDPQNWKLVADLVTELYQRTIESRFEASDAWREQIAALHGLLLHLRNGGTAVGFSRPPELRHWIAADPVVHRGPGEACPLSHWQWEVNSLRNLASGPQSLLFYRFPLSGDFEISCELPSLARDDLQLVYGGEFLFSDETRRKIQIGNVNHVPIPAENIKPRLSKPRETTWCRLVVRENVCSTFLNGRLVHRRMLNPRHDPWLAFRSDSSLRHPEVSNLRIDGDPAIPTVLHLVTEPSLAGWSSPDSSRVELLRTWQFADDERGAGLTSIATDEDPESRSDSLIQYYRPLATGESIEYEFFYGEGYQPAHPAIDDVAAIMESWGLTLRRSADGTPDAKFMRYDGLLKQDDWNTCRLSANQTEVQLILNGQLLHSFPLRDNRPPLIGLYREADARSVQIRNVIWRSEEAPDFDSLEHRFVNQVPRVRQVDSTDWDLIEHDFSVDGFPVNFFSSPDDWSRIEQSVDGLVHSVVSGDDWNHLDLEPYFSLQGDYEIVLEFEDLQVSEEAHGGCGIVLSNDDGRMIQFTRRERSENEHQVILTLRSPLNSRKVLQSQSLIVSEATSGRFRVVRQADTYHFSFAEADSDVFRTVAEETVRDAGDTADRFDIRMLAQRNTSADVVWKHLRVAGAMIDQSRFVASGETVSDEQWALIEAGKETLRELVLDGTQISDDDLARLKDHTGLRTLWLKGTPVTSQGIRHLEKLTQLESLHLTFTNVDDDVGETLREFTNLTSIGLSGSTVGDRTAEALSHLPGLQTIGLSRTAVTDDAIDSLSRIESLRNINLRGASVSASAVERLRELLPECTISY